MKLETDYGRVHVAPLDELFALTAEAIAEAAAACREGAVVALTGGSTPKAFYRWAVESRALDRRALGGVVWTVSDERHVPIGSPESNFGNARQLLLDPLGIDPGAHLPWPVDLPAADAAHAYGRVQAKRQGGAGTSYDLCLLGMGTDAHTASLFPGSPLLGCLLNDNWFGAVEVPQLGWRLTVTPAGLQHCGRILITVTGAAKAAVLREVLREPWDPLVRPVQLLREVAGRVTWLVDPEAAAELG